MQLHIPKFFHTTPLLGSFHWLHVTASIRSKTLMLAYKAMKRPAPEDPFSPHSTPCLQSLFKPTTPMISERLASRLFQSWHPGGVKVMENFLTFWVFFPFCTSISLPEFTLMVFFYAEIFNEPEDVFLIETAKHLCKVIYIWCLLNAVNIWFIIGSIIYYGSTLGPSVVLQGSQGLV